MIPISRWMKYVSQAQTRLQIRDPGLQEAKLEKAPLCPSKIRSIRSGVALPEPVDDQEKLNISRPLQTRWFIIRCIEAGIPGIDSQGRAGQGRWRCNH